MRVIQVGLFAQAWDAWGCRSWSGKRLASHGDPGSTACHLPKHPLQEFYANFEGDPTVKIPWVRPDLCGPKVLVMEWVDGIRCTDPEGEAYKHLRLRRAGAVGARCTG